jgi:hypothetical protein
MKAQKLIFSIALIFLLIFSLYGHSGRTDSNGGHYNRSTGEYHDHNGSSGTGWVIFAGVVIVIVLANSGSKKKK